MPNSGQTRGTILLVDDEPFLLAATARLLRTAGHTVHTCEEWSGILHAIRAEEPDLILLDYNMPTLKGDDLCAILRRNKINHRMKIFLFSSEPEGFLAETVSKCGADGYIKKDVASALLLEKIEGALVTVLAGSA